MIRVGFLFIGAIVISLIFISCSSDKSVDPYVEADETESLYMDIFGTNDYDDVEIIQTDSAEAALGLESGSGDSVTVDLAGEDIYIIATDSTMSESVALAIDCRMINFVQGNDSSKVAMYFGCEPESLVFENSLYLDISTEGFNNHPNSNALKLYLYNEQTNRWNVEAVGQKNNPRERFEINHFSKYAISD